MIPVALGLRTYSTRYRARRVILVLLDVEFGELDYYLSELSVLDSSDGEYLGMSPIGL